MEFVKIEGGLYKIGLDINEIEKYLKYLPYDIKPEFLYHSVPAMYIKLDEFEMSKNYITVEQFEKFIIETNYKTQSEIDGWGWTYENGWKKKEDINWKCPTGFKSLDQIYLKNAAIMPVLQVSCNDAIEYAKYLSNKTNDEYIIPDEFMWEAFAKQVGYISIKNLKVNEISQKNNYDINDYINLIIDLVKKEKLHKPGYIWEWTSSNFVGYNGSKPHKEYGDTYKVLRGGSALSYRLQKIAEYRFRRCPTARSPFYTFRVARKNKT